MREASIARRADVVLFGWQIRSTADATVAAGKDKTGQALLSANIEFLDSEQQLILDAGGVVWLIPAEEEYVPEFIDVTEQYLRLIRQPRSRRTIRPLTPEQEQQLRRLLSNRKRDSA